MAKPITLIEKQNVSVFTRLSTWGILSDDGVTFWVLIFSNGLCILESLWKREFVVYVYTRRMSRTLLFSLFCPVIFWPILSCAVIVWSGLVWFMCAWWIIDLLVFIVHFKTLAYDSIWCNVLANLENEIYKIFPEENFLSHHLGKSFHIVDAVTWHAKLVGIVAQASEIQEHLWSTNGKMIFQINMYYLQVKSTAQPLAHRYFLWNLFSWFNF